MSKLSLPKAKLSPPSRRVGFAAQIPDGPQLAPPRNSRPWKAWYGTARWRALKLKVHIRDGYTCQRTGLICGGSYPAPDSPVANHKIPHRGDERLFWDETNLETVSKEVHDGLIQAEEQGSRHTQGVWT